MFFQHDEDEKHNEDENHNNVPKINIESVSIEDSSKSSESSVEPEYVIKVENHKSESELLEEELGEDAFHHDYNTSIRNDNYE